MKKIILSGMLLVMSVICTACINSFAVQELNNKALEYLKAGETEKAICRLKASLDLDGSIYETNYNLGIALIENKSYDEAEAVLKSAIKIKADVPDTYVSLAIAQEGAAFQIINGETSPKKELVNPEEVSSNLGEEKPELSQQQKTEITSKLSEAIESYQAYVSLRPDASDKEEILNKIQYLNEQMLKYNPELPVEGKEIN